MNDLQIDVFSAVHSVPYTAEQEIAAMRERSTHVSSR
jgi:hypothetical protein